MVRPRFAAWLGLGLVSLVTLSGCYGNPWDKGDGSGVGTGRPAPYNVDQGRTGGLGAVRSDRTIGPGDIGTHSGAPTGGAR